MFELLAASDGLPASIAEATVCSSSLSIMWRTPVRRKTTNSNLAQQTLRREQLGTANSYHQ